MRLVPVGDRVVVKLAESEDVSKGGIVIPDMAKEKPRRGKVLAVGDGKLLDDGTRASFSVREGDEVVFNAYGGSEVDVDGQKFIVLTQDEILAVLKR